ncbi:hypothetical protein ONS95_007245 [Cadophora gregata]|uniref:uncharacterized protein n=1 Tax=Cadophora gregata TaxID=51156 RepID=UPI0026DB41BC|nr:uncharacterized protein ONS95_007245 [Cadophora gregata]KAK0100797.1 hypothetical protein ONS95_007245 [Cadophora gregata]KAK0117208.1 hypothetical protein ONS96_013042 [Cadophora gregata f. sp. sojae]
MALKLYNNAWHHQRKHQAKYTNVERQRIDLRRRQHLPVDAEDEEPYDVPEYHGLEIVA